MKKIFVLFSLLALSLPAFAGSRFSCENDSGYSISFDGTGIADLVTPYENARFGNVVKGGQHFFSSNVLQGDGVRSFSLKRQDKISTLRVWRKKPIVEMDEQFVKCVD